MKLPTVLESFRTGNRGEAFLEFIMSKHCLMHKVVGYKDIGIDYICEWLNENMPSRILFGIQVKTSERKGIEFVDKGINKRSNELSQFEIKRLPFDIKPETFEYWKGFNIPLYLFLVIRNGGNRFNCFYCRLTPILHETNRDSEDQVKKIRKSVFFQANKNSDFIVIVKRAGGDGGFARDLFFDFVRCSYQSGSVSYMDPQDLGINWPSDKIFPTVLGLEGTDYVNRVKEGLLRLQGLGLIKVDQNFENKVKEQKELLDR